MKITPLEIRQKSFEKIFRGYDKDEVSAYLQSLSQEWERMVEENKELRLKIEALQNEVNKLREVESSLFKTLKTAEDTGANLIEQAKKETEIHKKQSQLHADEIVNLARDKARKMVDNAEAKTKQILEEMINRVKTLEHHYNQVHDFRDKIIAQLKNYTAEISERNEKFEQKSEDLEAKDVLSDAKKIYNTGMLDLEMISKEEFQTRESIASTVEYTISSDNESIEDLEAGMSDENTEEPVASIEQDVPVKVKKKANSDTKSFFDEIE